MSFLTLVGAIALGMFAASLLEQGFRLMLLMIYSRRLSNKMLQNFGQMKMDQMMSQSDHVGGKESMVHLRQIGFTKGQ